MGCMTIMRMDILHMEYKELNINRTIAGVEEVALIKQRAEMEFTKIANWKVSASASIILKPVCNCYQVQ